MYDGIDIVELAMARRHQKYVLGARIYIAKPDWSGPWDCAEFVPWACYHAYKTVIAVRPPDVRTGESYSGWWYEDAERIGAISVKAAIGTTGTILVRQPGDFIIKIGHVAISRGDNSTIEANSAKVGVDVIENANTRKWTCGLLVPGVHYGAASDVPKIKLPSKLLELTSPYMRGSAVRELQEALLRNGGNPGAVDSVFGPSTAAAVAAFQAQEGLVVDGVVGPKPESVSTSSRTGGMPRGHAKNGPAGTCQVTLRNRRIWRVYAIRRETPRPASIVARKLVPHLKQRLRARMHSGYCTVS